MKYLMEKKNHCMHSFERLVRKMSMQIKDPREQDIFCSLLTRKDGMQELAEKYGLSAKELASMYERSVEEIMDDWDAMAQELPVASVQKEHRPYSGEGCRTVQGAGHPR